MVNVHQGVLAGDRVSYSMSFVAPEKCNIAVVPFGYSEGLDKRLSTCTKFLINKKGAVFWAKIAGEICMNLSCINCFNNDIRVGDSVQIISEVSGFDNSVDVLGQKSGISNYELLIRLNSNIKRVII